ncbi:MJ1255/VC2487 family glycosyltransferase [Methylococcus sp. EFPC2]|uniref:MJ1255/VC2487 family glycosyltransferase n=1 Tax=Methylococcus sp. EFPC2 TaxID=2812648 RepID=UPI0019677265|nr:MJ1255/VC2487 family glycosyltransferase [Methylococcus sp. EFPC2]QSA96862.1 glycosyltransferase [Methylococcus sp. EFPC2]
MRVFFGVQATGNGHITRARALAPKFKAAGAEITWMFTGRPWEHLFEMEAFGDFEWRAGLTFATRAGRIQYLKTARNNRLGTFVRDVRALDLGGYDVVVSDFEPVTAWAARLQGIPCVGIGHQYAFDYDIPKAGADFFGEQVLRWFAPVSVGLGLHWHHFHRAILPPLIESPAATPVQRDKIVVYLPFEDVNQVIHLLKRYRHYRFYVYSPHLPHARHEKADHIHVRQLSRAGFFQDFAEAAGVICNAGFELPSEALLAGKKLLVKPLRGQMEQLSNALALDVLQLGQVMQSLDAATITTWLEQSQAIRVDYPDVAQAVVDWLSAGDLRIDQSWIDEVWSRATRHTV